MNKLLVSDIIDLKNNKYVLNCDNKDLTINVSGNVVVYLENEALNNLNINLEDESILKIYLLSDDIKEDLVVNINQVNNSKIFYNASFINNNDNNLVINNFLKGNQNESYINIRNISNNGLSKIIINVEIDKNTSDNIALEDLKGINNGGFVHIEPNIVCLSNEVTANHLTTIGGVNKDERNYLMSKGISSEKATKILLKGFIYSNMDEYIKENRGE